MTTARHVIFGTGAIGLATLDPDTGAQDLDVLRKIHRQFDCGSC